MSASFLSVKAVKCTHGHVTVSSSMWAKGSELRSYACIVSTSSTKPSPHPSNKVIFKEEIITEPHMNDIFHQGLIGYNLR